MSSFVKTRFVFNTRLQFKDIKDPGVALTTLGVTDSREEPV
jgi:hypothetical protein